MDDSEITSDEITEDIVEKPKEQKQNHLIMFAKLNKYYLILFIAPVFCMITNYFISKIKDPELNIIKNPYVFNMLNVELFHTFAGLFYFISYFNKNPNKGKESDENRSSNNAIQYIYNETITIDIKLHILFLITLSSFMISERFILTYIYDNIRIDPRFYYIILIPLFSKLILRENLYKHQYLSLAISIIGWIIINIPICLKMKTDDIFPNFLNLIKGATYPLSLVIIKYLSDKYYIPPLKTSLVFGLMSTILTLLGFIIYSLIRYHDLRFFNAFDFSKVDDKIKIAFFFILIFIFGTALYLLNLLILFYFSPIYLLITEIISPFLLWIVRAIENNKNTPLELVLYPIGYFIASFSSLVCNEIIIFNCWGLSKNTKIFVNERMTLEITEVNKLLQA